MTAIAQPFVNRPQAQLCEGAPRRIRVSWSKLKNYETCHMRGKLYAQGKRGKSIDGRAFLPGTIADHCMRRWLEMGLQDRSLLKPGGMLQFLQDEWEKNTKPGSQYVIKWRGDPRQDQQQVLDDIKLTLFELEKILWEKVIPYDYQPEYRFVSVVGIPGPFGETVQIEILGAVDVAVCMSPGQYGLFDLKMTKSDEYLKSTLGQLTFYDVAFHGWMGYQPIAHEFWAPLTEEKIIPADVTETERTDMISRIIGYCEGIWSGDDALASTDEDCFFCQVKHACPRFVPQITKDQQGRNRASFATLAPKDGDQ